MTRQFLFFIFAALAFKIKATIFLNTKSCEGKGYKIQLLCTVKPFLKPGIEDNREHRR